MFAGAKVQQKVKNKKLEIKNYWLSKKN